MDEEIEVPGTFEPPTPTLSEREPASSWLQDEIRRLTTKKFNTMIAALGRPRIGKSYIIMRLGEVTDTNGDFGYDHIGFTPSAFMEKIQTLREGCFCMFDEPGATWNARDFMTMMNRIMGFTLQTFGSRYINVGFALPILPLMDLTGRQLLNFSVRATDRGIGYVYRHWVDVFSGKTYKERIGRARFKLPFQDRPEELSKYETGKKEFQDRNYNLFHRRAQDMEQEEYVKSLDPVQIAQLLINRDDLHVKFVNRKGELDVFMIMTEYRLGLAKGYQVKRSAEFLLRKDGRDLLREIEELAALGAGDRTPGTFPGSPGGA